MLVTALGLMTPVGWDTVTACASIRAGLARPSLLEDFPLGNIETATDTFPVGHTVTGLTDGFVLLGRWGRLLDGALESLWSSGQVPGPDDAGFWQATASIVVMPPLVGARMDNADDDEGEAMLLARACLRGPLARQDTMVLAGGSVGIVPALRKAQALLRARQFSRVLIAAVDSYIDPLSISWLLESRRLKYEDVPAGLQPGEAAACVLLETEPAARERGAAPILRVSGLGEGRDASITDEATNVGRGLAGAIESGLAEAAIKGLFAGDIISDQNGEAWRAQEFGGACAQLAGRLSPATRTVYPARSLGDVGAASAAVALAVAGRSFARGYASSRQALILASSERGESAALVVTAP